MWVVLDVRPEDVVEILKHCRVLSVVPLHPFPGVFVSVETAAPKGETFVFDFLPDSQVWAYKGELAADVT